MGLAQELKQSLATCTDSGAAGRTALEQGEVVAVMLENVSVCSAIAYVLDAATKRQKMLAG